MVKTAVRKNALSSAVEVNEHYVKPVTLAAGGMSYALMKLGFACDC